MSWWTTAALAATLSGQVVSDDGEPLEAVLVVAYDQTLSNTQTSTDAGGNWKIEDLERGSYRLRAVPIGHNHVERYHPGAWSFCDGTRLDLEAEDIVEGLDFSLLEGGSIEGLVLLDGAPRSGVRVLCRGEGTKTSGIVRDAWSGSDGRFELLGLDADGSDPYALYFSQDGLPDQELGGVTSGGERVDVTRGQVHDVGEVELLVGAQVAGFLEGFDGPVAGASVHLYAGSQVVSVTSDDEGFYVGEGIPAGDLVGWASRLGYAQTYWPDQPLPADTLPIDEGGGLEDYDFRMYEEAAITGVLDMEGDLSGVTIIAFNETNTVGLGTQAEADGSFRAGRLHEGRYTLFVYAEPEGYVQDYVRDAEGERVLFEVDYGVDTEVVVSMPVAGQVTGEVLDDAGWPVPGVTVYLQPTDEEQDTKATSTDRDGRYRVEGLRAGTWSAEVFYTPYCDRDPGWVRTFWPGTPNPEVQTLVTVVEGAEVGLDFEMPIDTDRDDMSDAWEDYWGLHVGRDDSAEDPDGDGILNLREYWEGTNPVEADAGRCRGGCGSTGALLGVWLLPLLVTRRRC